MSDKPSDKAICDFYDEMNATCSHTCTVNAYDLPPRVNQIIGQLSEGTMKRYLGASMVIPENIEGARILDIGCGSGTLVFVLSKLVGPTGYVVGMDISPGLIDTCKKESEFHWKAWGYDKANFEFHVGKVEDLLKMNLGEFDALVSNGVYCVLPDKLDAFKIAATLLKPGGQFYISDVFAKAPQPEAARKVETLWFMGLAASMVWNQLSEISGQAGFTTPYLTSAAGHQINNAEFNKILNNNEYVDSSWRLFKLPAGAKHGAATVTYKGNIPDHPEAFRWDINLTFKKGEPVNVDSELGTILANTNFRKNFDIKDYNGQVTTMRNQDPFKYLSDMARQGTPVKPLGIVD